MVSRSRSESPGRFFGSAALPPRTATTSATLGKPGRGTSHRVRPLGSFFCKTCGAWNGTRGPEGGRSLGKGGVWAIARHGKKDKIIKSRKYGSKGLINALLSRQPLPYGPARRAHD